MRYIAPARTELDASIFSHPVFDTLDARHLALCMQADWPEVASLNEAWQAPNNTQGLAYQFVAQERLVDGQHYEQRIYDHAVISTRSQNWHDLFNAMIWMRFPNIKMALNARQVQDLAIHGAKQRSRSQCAMTHFDEAGAILRFSDAEMTSAWDEHDWQTFFTAWPRVMAESGIQLWLFGHSIYEHALNPAIALVAKAIVIDTKDSLSDEYVDQWLANRINNKKCLMDPQELRPIPLSGLPYWHALFGHTDFFQIVPCFQAKRPGKVYPNPLSLQD